MPLLGFGVFDLDDRQTRESVTFALEAGYRLFDTAAVYGNERGVGAAIRASGLDRDEIFVTTKLWNSDHADPRAALERSLERLGLDAVDLYLVHWPDPAQNRYLDAWTAMESLQAEGLARAIGVSNFTIAQLLEVIALGGSVPAVNQIECHPLHPQQAARRFHAEHGILTQAWSPFARGKAFGFPVLNEIAAAHDRTPSQVILRWLLHQDVAPLPKSGTPSRIAENLDVWGFELTAREIDRITGLASDVRVDSTLYQRFQ